jgi:putative endonuclease
VASPPERGEQGSTRDRGRHVEARAAAFLRARGVEILATNVTMAGAEIDLVGRSEDIEPTIVFVEVRSRADADRGAPIETIGAEKRRRIVRAATAWLVANDLWERIAVRFDVVTVTGEIENAPIDWVVGAFEAGD